MKTVTNTDIKVQGTISGEKVKMTFDENSLAHIMSVLTDLYSNPELAIIREYSTNAFDAHVEAGVTRPIEVTLPSSLNFNLTIRDYGNGLDIEDIYNIYSKYGASTKRDTDDQVGMLGLGCKSALTYTSQFTLISVKNGVKIQALISRDDDGSGSIDILSSSPTDEPSGTVISIPAKRANNLEAQAQDFFSYWEAGKVLVNGAPPKSFRDDPTTIKLSDKIYITSGSNRRYNDGSSQIVMGNVPYPVTGLDPNGRLGYGSRIVAYVDIGEVAFTPSRESLYMSAMTKATITKVARDFTSALKGRVQEDIDKAVDHNEAYEVLRKWKALLRVGDRYTYKGETIPDYIHAPNGADLFRVIESYPYSSLNQTRSTIDLVWFTKKALAGRPVCLISGFDLKSFTTTHKKKLEKLLEDDGKIFGLAIVTKAVYNNVWLPKDVIRYTFDQVKDVKLPKPQTASGTPVKSNDPAPYSGWKDNKNWNVDYSIEDIEDFDGDVYYITTENKHISYQMRDFLASAGDKFLLLNIPNNRLAKFQRLFPEAKNVVTSVKDIADKWKNSLTSEQGEALAVTYRLGRAKSALNNIDLDRIEDPSLKKFIKLAQFPTQDLVKRFEHLSKVVSINLPNVENTLKRYPLLEINMHLATSYVEHVYSYVNAVYNSLYKGKV